MIEPNLVPRSVAEIDATDEGHWNHLLPDEDWALVVEEADRILEQRTAEEGLGGGAELQPLGLTPRRVSFPDTWKKNSGRIVRNQLWVNHTAECPLRTGFAESLTKWGNGGYNPRASWPLFVDPSTVVTWISFTLAAFLHGPANSLGWGWEQAGYARFTRAEWLSPDGLRQLDLLAQEIVRRGIPKDAVRWLSNTQVRLIVERKDTTTRGLCDHRQIDPKNRSDAGDGYPRDVLLDWIKSYHPDFEGRTPPGTPGTVRIGDVGPQVTEVQKLLNDLLYDAGTPDGVAGPMFDAAVRAFQKSNGLDVDGVVGPNTFTKLRSEEAIMGRLDPADIVLIGKEATKQVWSATVGRDENQRTMAGVLSEARSNSAQALAGQAAIIEAVKAAGSAGLDLDVITAAAQEGAERALSDLRIVKDEDEPVVPG